MKNSFILFLAIFMISLLSGSKADNLPSSVLVKTQSIKSQVIPSILICYGMVTPDIGSTEVLNFQKSGHISKLMVSEGELVKAGTPLLELVTSPSEELNYQKAMSELNFSRKEVERLDVLVRENLAPKSQLNNAQKALKDAESNIIAQKNLGTGRAQEQLKASFDGLILKIAVSQGDQIQVGSKLIELAHTDSLKVQLGVESKDCWKIKPDMKVKLSSILDEKRYVLAEISQVYGMINPKTQLVDVIVPLNPEQSHQFMPGMLLKGEIIIEEKQGSVVPRQAVLTDSAGAYIFQIRGGKAERVNIHTGIEQDGVVEIVGSFNPNEQVVVEGNYELINGMSVREDKK